MIEYIKSETPNDYLIMKTIRENNIILNIFWRMEPFKTKEFTKQDYHAMYDTIPRYIEVFTFILENVFHIYDHVEPMETRRQASQSGKSKYYTGKQCKRNHLSKRYTINGACVKCQSAAMGKYNKKIKEQLNGKIKDLIVSVPPDCIDSVKRIIEIININPGVCTALIQYAELLKTEVTPHG